MARFSSCIAYCLLALAATAGCGRFGFDQLEQGNGGRDADGQISDGAGGDGEVGDSSVVDAAAVGCLWQWDGASTSSWTISNTNRAGDPTDCCGCAPCFACPDDTSVTSDGAATTFHAGPLVSGLDNRRDGFAARIDGIAVTPGVVHDGEIDVLALSANIDGPVGLELYFPGWGIEVVEAGNRIGGFDDSWATAHCNTCPTVPADLGTKTFSFTPATAEVSLYIYGTHGSSQCGARAFDIAVVVDAIRITQAGC